MFFRNSINLYLVVFLFVILIIALVVVYGLIVNNSLIVIEAAKSQAPQVKLEAIQARAGAVQPKRGF